MMGDMEVEAEAEVEAKVEVEGRSDARRGVLICGGGECTCAACCVLSCPDDDG